MIPRILVPGEAMPAGALVVDCGAAGGAATYSHWQDAAPTPDAIAADTSTGIVVRAAADPDRWLTGFAVVVNDHVDADGLLALACACQPALARQHGALLIAAAEAGDFQTWPDEPGLRLMLVIHQVIRDARATGSGWEQRCATRVCAELAQLIDRASQPDGERDAAVAQAIAVRRRLQDRQGFAIEQLGDLATIAWTRQCGHAWDQFGVVHAPEDLPLWSLGGLFSDRTFQLLAEQHGDGIVYALDAPRHSWARTVVRPPVAWPDLSRACLRLNALERGRCRWVMRPEAQNSGFVCLLASVSPDGQPATSGLSVATVASAVREALRLRR